MNCSNHCSNFCFKESWMFRWKITANLDNQHLVADQILSENWTEIKYEVRTVFGKKNITEVFKPLSQEQKKEKMPPHW